MQCPCSLLDADSHGAASTHFMPDVRLEYTPDVSLYRIELFHRSGALRIYNVPPRFALSCSDLLHKGTTLSLPVIDACIATLVEKLGIQEKCKSSLQKQHGHLLGKILQILQVTRMELFADLLNGNYTSNSALHHTQMACKIRKKVCWRRKEVQLPSFSLILLEKSPLQLGMNGGRRAWGEKWEAS